MSVGYSVRSDCLARRPSRTVCFSSISSQVAVNGGAPSTVAAPTRNSETDAANQPLIEDRVSKGNPAENGTSPRSDTSDAPSSVGEGGATQPDRSEVSVEESTTLSPPVGVTCNAIAYRKGDLQVSQYSRPRK